MNSTAVIFDMDGVLVDTEPLYFKSNQALFRELGFAVPPGEYVHFVGSSATLMWKTLKDRFGLSDDVSDLIEMEYRAHAANIASRPSLPPIKGIRPLLKRLRSLDIDLAVASSSPRRVVEQTLAKSGLAAYFPVTVCGEEVVRGKPDPEIFLKAADLLETPPERCLVIEDSPRGIAGAKAAGMKTVGFQNPHSGDQDLSAADLVVASFLGKTGDRILSLTESHRPEKV